jgi:phosphate transport system substrate-binding protein
MKMKPIYLFIAVAFLASCGSGDPKTELDTPTTGTITISVDETFAPIMESELDVFHSNYKYAVINAQYVSEMQAFKNLLSDSARIAIVTRELNEEEKNYFKSVKITPRVTKVAIDAIALIVNKANQDSVISMAQLNDLFNGNTSTWGAGKGKSDQSAIQIVFDNANSSTARFIKEKFTKNFPEYCFAVNTNPEVINYVAAHPNAIGVIGVNWISDAEDSVSQDFVNKIQVMRIVSDSTDPRGIQPYQAYIAQGNYPLVRSVYVVSREARTGLGTGFASFLASDKGQRIILKSGLVPATMPVRIIGFEK